MKRIAILGGSFNPIHLGHIGIARAIIRQRLAEEVWLIVSPQNPLKKSSALQDEKLRLEWAQCAVKNIENVHASDFEFHLPRPSYTYNTLQALSRTYPDVAFSLVIGADNWLLFHKWKDYDKILNKYDIIIYPREGYHTDKTLYGDRQCDMEGEKRMVRKGCIKKEQQVYILNAPLFPFSSTEIRERLKNGADTTNMLPEGILENVKDVTW